MFEALIKWEIVSCLSLLLLFVCYFICSGDGLEPNMSSLLYESFAFYQLKDPIIR